MGSRAACLSRVAWSRANSAGAGRRDPAKAVEMARVAVDFAPESGESWRVLGIALCRAGKWKEGLEALEKSIKLRSGGDAYDWFFVAMAHARLGHPGAIARANFDKAVAWMEQHKPQDVELRRFRAEAEGVLGIKAKD